MTPEEIIDKLGLVPLPEEGGLYRETYRGDETLPADALPTRYGRDKSVCTCIYYLLTDETFSAMHRLPSDEIFHFYMGDPVVMLQLFPDGTGRQVIIGPDITAGEQLQVVAPHGVWQGTRLAEGGRWALMGVTVAPGFDFEDFELGARAELLADYPDHAEAIARLTRD